jgi:hypothetical protein
MTVKSHRLENGVSVCETQKRELSADGGHAVRGRSAGARSDSRQRMGRWDRPGAQRRQGVGRTIRAAARFTFSLRAAMRGFAISFFDAGKRRFA